KDTAPIRAIQAWVTGRATSWARKILRLRATKPRAPGVVLTYRVILGISMARVDQNATLARNRVRMETSASPTKVQILMPWVWASTSRVKYIHTEIAMIAGAAMAASRSTDLMP